MKFIIVSMVAAGLIITGSALAVDMPVAAKKHGCNACHAINKKVVGPAFNDVAAKYKGDKDAVGKLTANITKGGAFGWKFGTMPPKGMGASEGEIKEMAEFVAGLSK